MRSLYITTRPADEGMERLTITDYRLNHISLFAKCSVHACVCLLPVNVLSNIHV